MTLFYKIVVKFEERHFTMLLLLKMSAVQRSTFTGFMIYNDFIRLQRNNEMYYQLVVFPIRFANLLFQNIKFIFLQNRKIIKIKKVMKIES